MRAVYRCENIYLLDVCLNWAEDYAQFTSPSGFPLPYPQWEEAGSRELIRAPAEAGA